MPAVRAQASVEYFILLAVVLVILIFLSQFVVYDTKTLIEVGAARNAVDSIVKAANGVYARGPCNRERLFVEVPSSVVGSSVEGREVNLRIKARDGVTDVNAILLGNATGYLPTSQGIHEINIEYTCSGVLVVGAGLLLNESEIRLNATAGGSASRALNLTNSRDVAVTSIDSAVTGGVSSWASVAGLPQSLDEGAADDFTLTFNVPASTPAGTYLGVLAVNGTKALTEAQITLYVS